MTLMYVRLHDVSSPLGQATIGHVSIALRVTETGVRFRPFGYRLIERPALVLTPHALGKMNRRLHAVPVPCGNDRPEAGRGAGLVLESHRAYDGGPLLLRGARMGREGHGAGGRRAIINQ